MAEYTPEEIDKIRAQSMTEYGLLRLMAPMVIDINARVKSLTEAAAAKIQLAGGRKVLLIELDQDVDLEKFKDNLSQSVVGIVRMEVVRGAK